MKRSIAKLLNEYPVISDVCREKNIPINQEELATEANSWLSKQQGEDFSIKSTLTSPHGLIIKLTLDELEYAFAVGTVRTWFNETVLGWSYRHSGLPSQLAHSIGQTGEIALSKYFKSQKIQFMGAPTIVASKKDFRQDITINRKSVGIKSATKRSYLQIIDRGCSYYPAKNRSGESLRVLPYPEYLIQIGLDSSAGKVAVLGCVKGEQIMNSPVKTLFDKPTHVVPIASYAPIDGFFKTQQK